MHDLLVLASVSHEMSHEMHEKSYWLHVIETDTKVNFLQIEQNA